VTNASTECQEGGSASTSTIHDILVKETPCTRVAAGQSSHIPSATVPASSSQAKGKLIPRGKISNQCLRKVEADSVHEDDEASDGGVKDEDDLFECDELPIITRKTNATLNKEQSRVQNIN